MCFQLEIPALRIVAGWCERRVPDEFALQRAAIRRRANRERTPRFGDRLAIGRAGRRTCGDRRGTRGERRCRYEPAPAQLRPHERSPGRLLALNIDIPLHLKESRVSSRRSIAWKRRIGMSKTTVWRYVAAAAASS